MVTQLTYINSPALYAHGRERPSALNQTARRYTAIKQQSNRVIKQVSVYHQIYLGLSKEEVRRAKLRGKINIGVFMLLFWRTVAASYHAFPIELLLLSARMERELLKLPAQRRGGGGGGA